MKVADIANKFYTDLDSPADLSLVSLSFWIRNNLGTLNSRLLTSWSVDIDTLEVKDENNDEITDDAVSVYFQMYLVFYYDKKYRSNLTTMNNNMLISVKDNARSVTYTNRNEIGKTILQAKKQAEEELDKLVKGYKMKLAKPRQVIGDDTALVDELPSLN